MNKYLNKSKLKARGWTDALIKKFLPTSDATMKNPVYSRKGSPMCLYLASRVETIEKTDDFKASFVLSAARKKASIKATETKRKNVLCWVEELEIDVPDMAKSELIERAIDHFNQRKKMQKENFEEYYYRHYEEFNEYGYCEEPDFSLATVDSDPAFLARISVNYLRHQCTKYDNQLIKLYGKVGNGDAHDLLKKRVNEAIYKKYPWTAISRQ